MAIIGTSRVALGLATFALLVGCGSSTNPNAAAFDAYHAVIQKHEPPYLAAMSHAGTVCTAGSDADCLSALHATLTEATSFQQALKGVAAPPCLRTVSADLATSIDLTAAAINQTINGYVQSDPTTISAGADQQTQANAKYSQAVDEITKAHC